MRAERQDRLVKMIALGFVHAIVYFASALFIATTFQPEWLTQLAATLLVFAPVAAAIGVASLLAYVLLWATPSITANRVVAAAYGVCVAVVVVELLALCGGLVALPVWMMQRMI